MPDLRFVPAASFTLDACADIFTRSFERYFYAAFLETGFSEIDRQHEMALALI
jgi:hypothetical protein